MVLYYILILTLLYFYEVECRTSMCNNICNIATFTQVKYVTTSSTMPQRRLVLSIINVVLQCYSHKSSWEICNIRNMFLVVLEGGTIAGWRKADYLFSEDATCPDTLRWVWQRTGQLYIYRLVNLDPIIPYKI